MKSHGLGGELKPIKSPNITVGINFRQWENFVTTKSTTKITKIIAPLENYLPYGIMSNALGIIDTILEHY